VALSRAQRNILIEDIGLDPDRFELDEPDFGFWLKDRQSESVFSLEGSTYRSTSAPALWFGQKRVGADPIEQWDVVLDDWPAVVAQVRRWAAEIATYEKTPDLWELYRDGLRSSVEEATDNKPFTPEERTNLAARLDQVMAKLTEMSERHDMTAADVREIKETVEYLKDASTRLGKKDWALVLIGQAATYAGPVGRVFLGHMLHLPPAPPSLPM
jgi:hypothetical protein